MSERNGRSRRAIVYTHDLAARGGAERVAVSAAAALRESGYETVLVSHGEIGTMPDLAQYFDVDLSRVGYLPMPKRSSAPFGLDDVARSVDIWHQTRWLKRLRPDVFFNCGFRSEIPAVAPHSIYYVHFPHSLDLPAAGALRHAYMRAVRGLSKPLLGGDFRRGYGTVLANSQFTAGWVKKLWGIDADVLYPPCPQIGTGAKKRRKVILAVGRFQDREPGRPHKRQDVLIDAFAAMTDLHNDGWELHLAGSVGSRDELGRLQRAAHGLPIMFHPDTTQAELTELYQTSSIYWHAQGYGEDAELAPVTQEHFGISTVEAMSADLIPLVYGSAGPAEVVADMEGLGPWRTTVQLQDETRAVIGRESSLRASLVPRSRARAAEFSPETFRTHVQSVFVGETANDE